MIKAFLPLGLPARWNSIAANNKLYAPFFSQAWHSLWFEVFGQGWQPLTLLINNAVIAPLARQGNLVTFSGGREIADYLDIIGPDKEKPSAWRKIISYCQTRGIKQLKLFNVPESSATLSFFRQRVKTTPTIMIEREDTTPVIRLPDSWEKYLSNLSRHNRHELRRKLRNFEKSYPNLTLSVSKNPSEEITDFLSLMAQSLKKKTFLTQKMKLFFRKLPNAFPKKIILFFLKSGGKKIASILAFRENNSLLAYNSGYNREKFSVAGLYLKAMSLKWAIEHGIAEYNFLQGSERYKYELGGRDFFVYSVSVTI